MFFKDRVKAEGEEQDEKLSHRVIEDLFPDAAWLPQVYLSAGGRVAARAAQHEPPD